MTIKSPGKLRGRLEDGIRLLLLEEPDRSIIRFKLIADICHVNGIRSIRVGVDPGHVGGPELVELRPVSAADLERLSIEVFGPLFFVFEDLESIERLSARGIDDRSHNDINLS